MKQISSYLSGPGPIKTAEVFYSEKGNSYYIKVADQSIAFWKLKPTLESAELFAKTWCG